MRLSVRLSLRRVVDRIRLRRRCAGLSEPHGHDHRSLSGRRSDRPARARAGAEILREARAEFHRRERQRRRHDDRHRRVARGAKDGHTLLLHNLQISANVALYPKLPFDTEKELTPVAFINQNPLVLVGRKSLAANTLPELLALMKKSPLRMAHPGTGSTGHLATSLLAKEAKVEFVGVPYRGAAPALQDIAGGHVDLFFATPQSVVQTVASGQMKAYGITAKATSPQFPKVASFVDALGPKLEILYWHALFVPAGTPQGVIDKLSAVLLGVLDDPAVIKAWAETGVAPFGKDQRSPQAAQALMQSEIARWSQVVRENNIQPAE